MLQIIDGETYVNGIKMEIGTIPVADITKNLHYIKVEKTLELYDPISIKYEKNFEIIEEKIHKLPPSILEIIFYQSNIAIVWDEKLGTNELLKIKEAILKI